MRTILRHGLIYASSLTFAGVMSLCTVAVYTRLLSPEQYGRYTLTITAVSLASVLLYEGLRAAILRFLPQYPPETKGLLSTFFFTILALCAGIGVLGLAVAMMWRSAGWSGLVLAGVLMFWVQLFYDATLDIARSQLSPQQYAGMQSIRSVFAFAIGWLLAWWGLGSYAPLLALMAGMLLALILIGRKHWQIAGFDGKLLRQMLRYGLPISVVGILNFITSLSDRFILSAYHGEGAVGAYAAVYDLSQKGLILFISVVNTASYPVIVRTYEQDGLEEVHRQLHHIAVLLVGISVPLLAFVGLFSPLIVEVFIGKSFRTGGATIMTWVTAGILFGAIRSYYFDVAFHLGRSTTSLLWGTGTGALANILLNLLWIPSRGALGAAQATFVSYLLSCFVSMIVGRRVFPLPMPTVDWLKVVLSAAAMGSVFWIGTHNSDILSVIMYTALGALVYVGLVILLDVGGYRSRVFTRWSAQ